MNPERIDEALSAYEPLLASAKPTAAAKEMMTRLCEAHAWGVQEFGGLDQPGDVETVRLLTGFSASMMLASYEAGRREGVAAGRTDAN